jgi:plastocyanin
MSTVLRRLPRLVLLACVLATLGAVLLALAAGPVAAQAQGAKEVAGTVAQKWEPANVQIQPGQSVTFKVTGAPPHPVVSGDGSNPQGDGKFDAKACTQDKMGKVGATCTIKFAKAGSYPFFCSVHVSLGMKGVITVGKGGGGATTTAPQNGGAGSGVVAPPSTGGVAPPGKPVIYYAGYGLVAGGVLLALIAFASYVRYAPSFRRQSR